VRGGHAAAVGLPGARPRPRALRPEAVAWSATIPVAIAVALAAYALGPPLGRLLQPDPHTYAFFAYERPVVHPEPTEHGRFVVLLVAPVLLALLLWLVTRRPRVPRLAVSAGGALARVVLVGVLAGCVVAQYTTLRYGIGPKTVRARFFVPATLVTAAVIAVGLALALGGGAVQRVLARRLSDSRATVACAYVAVLAVTAIAMLPAVHTDGLLRWTNFAIAYTTQFPLDETFAVLNGRTPLVNFTTQYSALWPYVLALVMAVLGKTLLVFSTAMATVSTVALASVFGVLRRVTRSAAAALALYLPFLATSLFRIAGSSTDRFTPGTYLAAYPLRYALPLLLAWMTARLLSRPGRRLWPAFLLGGLAVVNNVDFGLAALVATFLAIGVTSPRLRAEGAHLVEQALLGVSIALALVTVLTLARSGSLPHFGRLLEYPRMYLAGYMLSPIRSVLGLHLAIYLTYVAALAVASVRVLRREPDRVLTGMLAWSGAFGLGAGGYFVAESEIVQLTISFTPWALTLMLLVVVVLRERPAGLRGRLRADRLAVLFGAGLAICSLAQMPMPWAQVRRLTETQPIDRPLSIQSTAADARMRDFFASIADGRRRFALKHGAPAAILVATGHRIADQFGIVNVSPYTGFDSVHTRQRLGAVIRALRRAGGNTLIAPDNPVLAALLRQSGFLRLTRSGLAVHPRAQDVVDLSGIEVAASWAKWVDASNLHPRALRGGRGVQVRGY
jgi:hypothetical protein